MTVSLLKYKIRTRSGGIWDDLNERETDYQPFNMGMDEKIDRLKAVCVGIGSNRQEAEIWNGDDLVLEFVYYSGFFRLLMLKPINLIEDDETILIHRKVSELDSALKEYERKGCYHEMVLNFEMWPYEDQFTIYHNDKDETYLKMKYGDLYARKSNQHIDIMKATGIRSYLNNG